jgi:hypothetical protein
VNSTQCRSRNVQKIKTGVMRHPAISARCSALCALCSVLACARSIYSLYVLPRGAVGAKKIGFVSGFYPQPVCVFFVCSCLVARQGALLRLALGFSCALLYINISPPQISRGGKVPLGRPPRFPTCYLASRNLWSFS